MFSKWLIRTKGQIVFLFDPQKRDKFGKVFYVPLISLLFATILFTACSDQTPPPPDSPLPTAANQQSPLPSPTPTPSPTPVPSPTPSPAPTPRIADADVLFVRATLDSDNTWTFDVTVEHPDTGWDDYADGWDVVLHLGDGIVVKPDPDSPFTRLLLHPHENEQPFTRSQSGIVILEVVEQVTVRAHDLVDGWGGEVVMVDLSQASGPDFEVIR